MLQSIIKFYNSHFFDFFFNCTLFFFFLPFFYMFFFSTFNFFLFLNSFFNYILQKLESRLTTSTFVHKDSFFNYITQKLKSGLTTFTFVHKRVHWHFFYCSHSVFNYNFFSFFFKKLMLSWIMTSASSPNKELSFDGIIRKVDVNTTFNSPWTKRSTGLYGN